MTLRELMKLCRENIVALCVATVLGLLAATGYLFTVKPAYQSTAIAYVGVDMASINNNGTNVGSYVSASQLALQKAQAIVPLFNDRSTAELVKKRTESGQTVGEIASALRVTYKPGTLTISVTAKSFSEKQAQILADAAVESTAERVASLEGENSPVRVKLMSSATLSPAVISPKKTRVLGSGVVFGLALGFLFVLLRRILDTKVRSEEDIKGITAKPVLALLPDSQTIARNGGQVEDDGSLEYIRKLRTSLRYSKIDGEVRTILFTSAMPGEGKSSTALSLARVLAMAGRKVILVDADLRRPTVQRSLGLSSPIGLSQLLAGVVPLESVLQESGVAGLKVIAAGDLVPNPSELLGSNRMKELLKLLGTDHTVIIDGPPLLPVTDSVLLAGTADATVLVVKAGVATREDVARSVGFVESSGGYLAGLVLNRVSKRELAKYGYSAKYGYGYAPHEQKAAGKRHRK